MFHVKPDKCNGKTSSTAFFCCYREEIRIYFKGFDATKKIGAPQCSNIRNKVQFREVALFASKAKIKVL